MEKDTRTRKWMITINNPQDKGYSHEHIKEIMKQFRGCIYWCMADEIGGERQTYHTHIYMCCKSAVKFSVMQCRFPKANLDMCKGTSGENRDYVFKLGKWEKTVKAETRVADTQEEFGELPLERQGARNDIADLYDMIKQGMSDYDIMEQSPDYLLHLDKIERARQTIRYEKYKDEWRDLQVTYIWGDTGAGKTRSVMEKYGYSNVFRVTDYQHPFDNYKGQDVIVFEEFRSSLKIGDMLNYLDGYPLELPSRYANKYACYTKVYIITNEPLSAQYSNTIQLSAVETYNAFLRRIHRVLRFTGEKILSQHLEIDRNGFVPVLDGEYTAFDDIE